VKLSCVELIKYEAIKIYSSVCIKLTHMHASARTHTHTFHLNIRWTEGSISHTSQSLHPPWKVPLVTIGQETGWVPQQVRKVW
jgi:hypothetical protein